MTDIYSEYRAFCRRAVLDPAVFATFRQNPVYRGVLEHTTVDQGWGYLREIDLGDETQQIEAAIQEWHKNDSVGSPFVSSFGSDFGDLCPSTLRYAKCISDLDKLFGDLNGARIVEVGGGYGGLARLAQAGWACEYVIVDLPEPLALAQKYLLALGVTGVSFVDALTMPNKIEADLFVSNYALSEFSTQVMKDYVKFVALRCPRGYVSANAAADTLPKMFGPIAPQLRPEVPLTGPNNYMLLWGVPRPMGGLEDETKMPPFRSSPFDAYGVPRHLLVNAVLQGAEIFVETGFGVGMSAATASELFEEVLSVELSEEHWQAGSKLFAGVPNVHLLQGDSGEMLPKMLADVGYRRAVVWLDAHYSGGKTAKGATDTPIRAELKALAENHSRRDHFLLIDDLLSFTGTDGYPTVEELVQLVKDVNPLYKIKLHGALRRGILEASV